MRIDLAEVAASAALAHEARREALPNIERRPPAARNAGVKVVHCLVQRRPNGLGGNRKAKIFAVGDGSGGEITVTASTPSAELLPELGRASTGPVLRGWHGIGPMGGTENVLSLLATITTTDNLIEVWK